MGSSQDTRRAREGEGRPRGAPRRSWQGGAGDRGQGSVKRMGAEGRRHGEFRSVTEVTCSMQKSPVSGNLFIHGVKWHLCVTRPVQPAWSSAAGPDAVM